MEAPSGIEPLNKGFADPPLSHLGTAPIENGVYQPLSVPMVRRVRYSAEQTEPSEPIRAQSRQRGNGQARLPNTR